MKLPVRALSSAAIRAASSALVLARLAAPSATLVSSVRSAAVTGRPARCALSIAATCAWVCVVET